MHCIECLSVSSTGSTSLQRHMIGVSTLPEQTFSILNRIDFPTTILSVLSSTGIFDFQYPQPDRLPYNHSCTIDRSAADFQYPQPDRLPYNTCNIGTEDGDHGFQYPQPDRLPYNVTMTMESVTVSLSVSSTGSTSLQLSQSAASCNSQLSVSSTGSTSLQPHQFQTRTMPKFLKNSDTDPLTTFSERQISPISLQQVYHRDTNPETPFCSKTGGIFEKKIVVFCDLMYI